MSGRCALEAVDLKVSYGGQVVVGPFSLRLNYSEVVSLMGPSGCGKTSFVRAIAGLEALAGGALQIRSEDWAQSAPRVGCAFQETDAFPWLTAEENIRLAALSRDPSAGQYPVAHSLERVGLGAHAGKYPGELSGGMRKRLGIQRLAACGSRIAMLDEPFASLDVFTRRQLWDDWLSLTENEKMAILLVTHDIEEALYLSDRILVCAGPPLVVVQEFSTKGADPSHRMTSSSVEWQILFRRIEELLISIGGPQAARGTDHHV